jgi:glycosyltransferase involved in cell wall biosynthesis
VVDVSPDVSVVVPTHNRSGLLAQTLRSVLWQRGVDLEVLVVDDGSTDDTAAVVAALNDPRVRLLRHGTPRGVSAARNRGVAAAGGRWLAFCDDDDLWAPDKLARQLAAAQATGRSWVYAGEVHIDLGGQVVGGAVGAVPVALPVDLQPDQRLAFLREDGSVELGGDGLQRLRLLPWRTPVRSAVKRFCNCRSTGTAIRPGPSTNAEPTSAAGEGTAGISSTTA